MDMIRNDPKYKDVDYAAKARAMIEKYKEEQQKKKVDSQKNKILEMLKGQIIEKNDGLKEHFKPPVEKEEEKKSPESSEKSDSKAESSSPSADDAEE